MDNTNMGFDEIDSYSSDLPLWVYAVEGGSDDVRFDAKKLSGFSNYESKSSSFTASLNTSYLCSNSITATLPNADIYTSGGLIILANCGAAVDILTIATDGDDAFNKQPGQTSIQIFAGETLSVKPIDGNWIIV